jgi:hypothetical protein
VNSGEYGTVVKQLEQAAGVSFKEHFSFAISVLLMKGLGGEGIIRETTLALIKQLLFISNSINAETGQSLGFITALLPFDKQLQTQRYKITNILYTHKFTVIMNNYSN